MAIYKSDIVNVELNGAGILRTHMNNTIGKSDDDANRFGVRVLRNGAAEDLTGISCTGYFTDSTGAKTTLTGTVSGNEAYVTLTDDCYTHEGTFRLAIKLSGGGVTSTMRIVDGMVENIA